MPAPVADTIRWDLRLDGNVIERSIGMQSKVTEIAPGTYRISTFHPDLIFPRSNILMRARYSSLVSLVSSFVAIDYRRLLTRFGSSYYSSKPFRHGAGNPPPDLSAVDDS